MTTLDPAVASALTDEARRQKAALKVATKQGQIAALSSISQAVNSAGADAQQELTTAQAELAAISQNAGPGITDDFGPFSTTDQSLRTERFAGKAAVVDLVKAAIDPTTVTVDQAVAAYTTAGLGARPVDRQWLLHNPQSLLNEYAASLVAEKILPDATWESFRALIVATDRTTLLAMS